MGADKLSPTFELRGRASDDVWGAAGGRVARHAPGTPGEHEECVLPGLLIGARCDACEERPLRSPLSKDPQPKCTCVTARLSTIQIPKKQRLHGRVEFNPSRIVDAAGCSLVPHAQLPAVERVWEAISPFVTPVDDGPERAHVTRIDVARDFRGVRRLDMYLVGLQRVRRPYAKLTGTWTDPKLGGAQTVMTGSKSAGMARLYAQGAAYPERGAQPDWARFEVQARAGGWADRILSCCTAPFERGAARARRVREHGLISGEEYGNYVARTAPRDCEAAALGAINMVADLYGDAGAVRMATLSHERWGWSGMGLEVGGIDAVLHALLDSDYSPSVQGNLLRLVECTQRGLAHGYHRNSERAYWRKLEALGILFSDGELPTGALTGRLDWDSGTEVLRAA
jgi:hypothetical protein